MHCGSKYSLTSKTTPLILLSIKSGTLSIMRLPKEEITRKLLHLIALAMPVGIYYLPQLGFSWYVPTFILAIMLGGSVIIEKLRQANPVVQALFYKMAGSMLRKEERNRTTGSTWVIGAAFICSIIFRNDPWVAFVVLTLFVLGDAIAALVGMSIGRIRIGEKSLEGSTACFGLCMVLFYAVFPFIPGLIKSPGGYLPIVVTLATSFTITVFELVPLRITPKLVINDNLAVPVIAGMVLRWTTRIFE
ncbi:MAG: hypothetical protein A4E58_03026 [Syntrophorhabdus sp. PtaB.Bin006]|nr:MAG: hypothetical protein A4E58_03026 [Syntrophorhabdus sp. PtaB.Bin006]